MTIAHKLVIALSIVLALGLSYVGYSAYKEAIANATLKAQTDANNASIASLQQSNKAVAQQLNVAIQTMNDLKKNTRTTTQIVQAAPQVITLPSQVREVTAADAAKAPDGPAKAGDLIIPADSTKAWFDAQVDCKANAAKLDACTQTNANNEAVIAVKDTQIEQDKVALKGGTQWQRFRSGAIKVAIGGGIAVGVVCGTGHCK